MKKIAEVIIIGAGLAASINAAMKSGRLAAEAIINTMRS